MNLLESKDPKQFFIVLAVTPFSDSIVNIFLKSPMLYYVISWIGVLVFVGLTAYDTQRIKEMYYASDHPEISGKKAIMGALKLYLDFINLFIMLLHLFGQRR